MCSALNRHVAHLPQPQWSTPSLYYQAAPADIDLVVAGHERSLPPRLELTIYRIVQEALTNALKHSGGARAEVRVTYDDQGVRVLVRDDGRAPRQGVSGTV